MDKPSILKRGLQYFTITTKQFKFNDTLNFTSPCNYSKYLKQWRVDELKSIFPYQHFNSIEQLQATTEFPPHSAFFSSLTQKNVDLDEYERCRAEFNRRKALPDSSPEKMRNMGCWLKYYNTLDVGPLVQAMSNCFEAFFKHFHIDATQYLSLPTIAQTALYTAYDPNAAFIYSFGQKWDEIRQLHRENINGGMVACYHRYINLANDDGPINSRYAPNGDRYTHLIQLDFNSLYGCMQRKRLPTTPGILWKRFGGRFQKNVMTTDVSYPHLQWLYYIQATDPTLGSSKIQHKYFRGEVSVGGDLVDGYVKLDDGSVRIYEFNGCQFHGCTCQGFAPNNKKLKKWIAKKSRLESFGQVIVKWEHEWNQDLMDHRMRTVKTDFPRILHRRDTEKTLLDGIRDGTLYGFILCDVETDEKLIEELKELNFPPVFNKVKLTNDHLSPFMLERFNQEGRTLDQTTLVQTFNASQVFLLSELARFYMELGMKLKNIKLFTQYLGEQCFAPFIDKVTTMRIQATYEGDETKSNTAKVIGNSAYGKLLQDPTKQKTHKIIPRDKLLKYLEKNTCKDYTILDTEAGPTGSVEINLIKKCVTDKQPVHVGNAVLQHSKLHFLR